MKILIGIIFAIAHAVVFTTQTGFHFLDWQYWVLVAPLYFMIGVKIGEL